jgi:hypothetical protein
MLFYLLMIGGGITGAALGAELGAKLFGAFGGIAGALAGGILGYLIGSIPYVFANISISKDVGRKSVDELHASLRGAVPMCPNFVLLELQARGEKIQQHLPFVLDLMEASDIALRQRGLAALHSAFPELAKQLGAYRLHASADARHEAVARMRTPI